jgi:hypothetical protein
MAGVTFEQREAAGTSNTKPNVVTVPGHSGDDVPVGTLRSVLKAAGLEAKK